MARTTHDRKDWHSGTDLDTNIVLDGAVGVIASGTTVHDALAALDAAPGGGDLSYVHDQLVPSATWSVAHNLGKNPSVTVVDSGATTVIGDVVYIDLNNLEIHFATAFGGAAYLN